MFEMALLIGPGVEGGALGDGDEPVKEDMAEDTGEVTGASGDDSAGAGPTPPAVHSKNTLSLPSAR